MKRYTWFICAAFAAMALFVMCNDSFEVPANGMGRVTIRIAGTEARTLLPDVSGLSYKLTVVRTGISTPLVDATFNNNGFSWSGELNNGTYTVTVIGYETGINNPILNGTETFTLIAGEVNNIAVVLNPAAITAGTLSYNVSIPATMNLLSGELRVEAISAVPSPNPVNLAANAMSGSITLQPGYYRVFLKVIGTVAGEKGIYTTTAVVYIVGELVTTVVYDLTADNFNSAEFCIVTFDFNYTGAPNPVTQEVRYGAKATKLSPDPVRTGYAIDGWCTEVSLTNLHDFDSAITTNITLYARWTLAVEMVFVPGGSFNMGGNQVTLSGFYMGRTEVTQTLYQLVMGNNPSRYVSGNLPVEQVTWYNAIEFCNKLSGQVGLQSVYTISGTTVTANWSRNGYRLPTEAEWEYAARGGNGSPGNFTYAGSNTVGNVAWYRSNTTSSTREVGTKSPNGLGIYDMSGNVEEWCWDWYGSYSSGSQTDPHGASSGSSRVVRGGNWLDLAEYVTSTYRYGQNPSHVSSNNGFRIARPNGYDPDSYVVVYNINGGTGTPPAAQTSISGSTVTLPGGGGFSRGSYAFGGWNTNASGTGTDYNAGSSYTVTGNVTLYAKWIETVTFDLNGGTGTSPATQTANSSTTITLPGGDGFFRSNYTFGGWNTNADGTGTNYNAGSSYTVTGNVTLYAKWIEIYYTVTFDINGGTGTSPAEQTVHSGSNITLPNSTGFSKSGYAFAGWNTNAGGTGTNYNVGSSYTVTGNVTLYARWASIFAMVYVPGGSFEMGNPDSSVGDSGERPVHTVTLTGFYMGKYEVTQVQYQTVMGSLPSSLPSSSYAVGDNYPVYYVSWYDTLVFCNKLSMMEGLTPAYRINNSTDPAAWGSVPTSSNATWNAVTIDSGSTGYRLPTEAQWEYAAKGGNGSPGNYTYAGSNNPDVVAWYSDNSGSTAHTVGTKTPNGLGIYDMSGNVYEWCWDWYGTYSNSNTQVDPVGLSSGAYRVIHGGFWGNSAEYVRSAHRGNTQQATNNYGTGFRIARPAQ